MRKSIYLSLILTIAVLAGALFLKGQQTQVLGSQTTSLKDTFLRGLKEFASTKSGFGTINTNRTQTKQATSSASFDSQLKEIDTLMNNAQKIDLESDPTVGL